MKDLVRIVDYVKWLEIKKKECEDQQKENDARLEKEKQKFNSGLFYKIFKAEYHMEWWEQYNHYRPGEKAKFLQTELNRCAYMTKTQKGLIDMPDDWYGMFYNWCSKNNIPY